MQYTMIETNEVDTTNTIRVDSIRIVKDHDDNPDLSYLDYDNDPYYADQNAERLNAYHNGDWHCIGIHAECFVSYSVGGRDRRIEFFQSTGIWGVESDAGKEYHADLSREQMADLRSHCERFGVDMDSFDKQANNLSFN